MVWNVSPILLSIGPLTIHWYGFLFAMGFLLASRISEVMFKKEGHSTENFDKLVFYMIVGTLLGARLGHTLIYEPEIYLHDPIRILKIWEGGLASHGGTIGVITGVYIWKRRFWRGNLLSLLDIVCVPSALVGALIRLGNLFNSEILGRPTDLPWGVIFSRVNPLPRHPSMVYESIAYLITYLILNMEYKKELLRKNGFITGTFFVLIFTFRFLIEFTKELQVQSEVGLPMDYGQLLSIPFVILGIVLMVRAKELKKGRSAL